MQVVIAPPSLGELFLIITGIATTLISYRVKIEFKSEGDKLREEVTKNLEAIRREFIPGNVAELQRENLVRQVEENRIELNKLRENLHTANNRMQELMLGPIQEIRTQLTDKARRMGGLEEKVAAMAEAVRDTEDVAADLSRRFDHLERQRRET